MTDQPATKRPALLPADHRERVLTLLKEVGIEAQSEYAAHNGVVRVKVKRMTGSQWLAAYRLLTGAMVKRDWFYGISHSEFFIEQSDELTFRPAEAMR